MTRQSYETPEVVEADDTDALAERLRVNGFAVLRDVVPLPLIARLRDAYAPLLAAAIARGPNRGPRRHSIAVPFAGPFSDPALHANPAILALCERVLGEDLACDCLGSDTCEPGATWQPVHRDEPGELFPDAPGASLPTFEITVNIPLADVGEDDGPMELWPGGTQRMPSPRRIEQVASGMTSWRATLSAGSVLLRDLRAWHRGTPNRSPRPRPMLAICYTRPWFRYGGPIRVPAATWAGLGERSRRLLRFATIVP